MNEQKLTTDDQIEFYTGLAVIIKADLPDKIGNYALITHAIRYRLKGLSTQFIEDSIDELTMADKIEINLESNG